VRSCFDDLRGSIGSVVETIHFSSSYLLKPVLLERTVKQIPTSIRMLYPVEKTECRLACGPLGVTTNQIPAKVETYR